MYFCPAIVAAYIRPPSAIVKIAIPSWHRAPAVACSAVLEALALGEGGRTPGASRHRRQQLFALEDAAYRDQVASLADRWDSMVVSNRSKRVTRDWIAHPLVEEYSLTSDRDDRWRTGGTVDEVIEEAHLSPRHILEGIGRFVRDRERRLRTLREVVPR